jgi:hypothetical protein
MDKQEAKKAIQAPPLEIVRMRGTAVHKLFICSKRDCSKSEFIPSLFKHTNNLQTVTRLVVDKFTSQLICDQAFDLLVNLPTIYAWERKKNIIYPLFLKNRPPKKGHFNFAEKRDILTLR